MTSTLTLTLAMLTCLSNLLYVALKRFVLTLSAESSLYDCIISPFFSMLHGGPALMMTYSLLQSCLAYSMPVITLGNLFRIMIDPYLTGRKSLNVLPCILLMGEHSIAYPVIKVTPSIVELMFF